MAAGSRVTAVAAATATATATVMVTAAKDNKWGSGEAVEMAGNGGGRGDRRRAGCKGRGS